MNESKNLILAVVLSALVLLGWGYFSQKFAPSNPPPVKVEDGQTKPVPQPQASPVPNTPPAMRNRTVVLGATPRVRIQTPSLQGSINLQGGRIDDLVLVRDRDDGNALRRVGFTVSKKVGGAVVRNRMKRRFRALAREILPEQGYAGADHVMIGRGSGIERDFGELRQDLVRALAKARP